MKTIGLALCRAASGLAETFRHWSLSCLELSAAAEPGIPVRPCSITISDDALRDILDAATALANAPENDRRLAEPRLWARRILDSQDLLIGVRHDTVLEDSHEQQ